MSLQNLTIGRKISFGFGLIFALLIIVAAIAYTALGGAGRRLSLFSDSAQETYAAASLESSMQELKLQTTEFLTTGTAQDIAEVEEAKKKLDADLAAAAKLIVEQGRAQEIAKARELLGVYQSAFNDLVANQRARVAIENDTLTPQAKVIADGLQGMLKQAQTQGDMNAAFQISNGLKAFFESTSLVKDFLLTSDAKKATAAADALKVTVSQMLARLEERGLVMIAGEQASGRGPNAALYAVVPSSASKRTRCSSTSCSGWVTMVFVIRQRPSWATLVTW